MLASKYCFVVNTMHIMEVVYESYTLYSRMHSTSRMHTMHTGLLPRPSIL